MVRKEFITYLSNKTGVLESDYDNLLKKYEEKTNTNLNNCFKMVPENFSKLKIFKELEVNKINLVSSDIKEAKELGVSADSISGIRTFNDELMYRTEILNRANINFAALNDYQKGLVTSISYLDFTQEGIDKINNGGLTIKELRNYLANENARFVGNPLAFDEISEKATDLVAGKGNVITDLDVYNELINVGMGDIKITNVTNITSSGFTAMTLEDESGNKAISFKGSDFDYNQNLINDWLIDASEYLVDESLQSKQANEYFKKVYEENKGMYIYGHSLGGGLVNHVFVNNHDKIDEAFSFCGIPISDSKLDTQEKIDAFNSDKYSCYAVAGDIVSNVRNYDSYVNNVHFIKCTDNTSFISCHVLQTAELDVFGNFVLVSKEQAFEEMKGLNKKMIETAQTTKVIIDKAGDVIDKTFNTDSGKYVMGAINGICKICTFFKDEIQEFNKNVKNTVEDVKDVVENVKDWASDKINDFKEAAENFFDTD